MQIYSGFDRLPTGQASTDITPGCLVLEGGGWRGLYTQGALDALMEAGINFQTVIGVSAGAMSAIGYLSGQIGYCARINLAYRQDRNYTGLGALKRDHGVTGFSYLFHEIFAEHPLNEERFNDPARRMIVGATNCDTGEIEYFEKGHCSDIFKAVQASASVPYVTEPVMIDGKPYLDGGCAVRIPYQWAKDNGFTKIMVIRTRDRSFQKNPGHLFDIHDAVFHKKYPNLQDALMDSAENYNLLMEAITADEAAGRTYVLAPAAPVTVSRFESDLEKLGDLYWRGYREMTGQIQLLKGYLTH